MVQKGYAILIKTTVQAAGTGNNQQWSQFCCIKKDPTEVFEVLAPMSCKEEPCDDLERVRQGYQRAMSRAIEYNKKQLAKIESEQQYIETVHGIWCLAPKPTPSSASIGLSKLSKQLMVPSTNTKSALA